MNPSDSDIASSIRSSIVLNNLLEQVKIGDSEATKELYNQFAQQLIFQASRRISQVFRSKIDPEDIVQSVFRSFFVRFNSDKISFESWGDLYSFLLTVTARKCGENARKLLSEKRNINREIVQDRENVDEFIGLGVSKEPTPEQVAIFEETLCNLLDPLSESQRTIFRMRLDGHQFVEISEKLGRSERTMYRTMKTLKKRMRAILNQDESPSDVGD